MLNKIKLWLFPTTVDGFKFDAVDRDGDGIVQEGTAFERKIEVVSKPKKKAVAKKAPAKKAPAKKAPTKKAPVKKAVTKKAVKKSTKKK